MKAVKIILNIFGIILASVLSIALFAMLIASPIVSAATNMITPNTIEQVVSDIDVEALLDNVMPEENESGIPKEVISQVLESDVGKEFIELYSEEFSAAFKGEATEGISADDLKQLFNENIDEIVDIMHPYVSEEEQITKEELKTTLSQELDTFAEEIVAELPDASQIINTEENNEMMQALTFVLSGTILKICIAAVIILSGLIYALRFPRFKGFMWLGSVYFLATCVVLIIGFAGTSVAGLSNLLLENIPAEIIGIVTPLISVIFAKITNGGLVLLALTALFITAFILCRIFIVKRKKEKAAAEDAVIAEAAK